MTIQKAIKSGKPFRRKTWGKQWPGDWYVYPDHRENLKKRCFRLSSAFPALSEEERPLVRDILATDWEIKK